MRYWYYILISLFFTLHSHAQEPLRIEEYGNLFDTVQLNEVFSDQKKFVDIKPKFPPGKILENYHLQKENETFNLKAFIADNFDTTFSDITDILNHINLLWNFLSRSPDKADELSTLIPLKHPYIVPGGRFREIYYWDSYFTMLGLAQAGKHEMIKNMLDNISDLINTYGFMPNGNRTYYLSRSQPPFFSSMVELYANCTENKLVFRDYYSAIKKEYNFWNKGKNSLKNEFSGYQRVVRLYNNDYLNRYWDNLIKPRPESYLYDIKTKREAHRDSTIYREIRAAAESGWDFSTRWFDDYRNLSTIKTTNILPVDLNCLLYNMELVLSQGCTNIDSIKLYEEAAARRRFLIIKYFWDEEKNFFFDYNFKTQKNTEVYSLAALYPLFFNIADTAIARKVSSVIKSHFLMDGGLVTTLNHSGQQWDYPNGWAPLQWIGYIAFKNYGLEELARIIALRWINLNVKVFFETHKMMEKYDVVDINKPGGGGEYTLQDGFGWTNGVFLKLWHEIKEK
jgi:alpha,alpha-trehalase